MYFAIVFCCNSSPSTSNGLYNTTIETTIANIFKNNIPSYLQYKRTTEKIYSRPTTFANINEFSSKNGVCLRAGKFPVRRFKFLLNITCIS